MKLLNDFNVEWRRDRDSNPGSAQTDNGFRDRRIRPLCHLSAVGIIGGGISGVEGVVQDEKSRPACDLTGLGIAVHMRHPGKLCALPGFCIHIAWKGAQFTGGA